MDREVTEYMGGVPTLKEQERMLNLAQGNRTPWPQLVALAAALSVPLGILVGLIVDEQATHAFLEYVFGD